MKWFTSDLHLGHTNIAGPDVSNWESGYRDFKSVHQMNKTIIDNINHYVAENDELYILGDFAFRNPADYFYKINCKNIYLILGNHDRLKELKKLPFKSINYYGETYIANKQKVCMFHYACRVWNKSHRGSFLLYGHSHNSIDNNWGRSMDVGIDAINALGMNYRPLNENEVYDILSKRDIKVLDHHKMR